jgi:hypothetical protein
MTKNSIAEEIFRRLQKPMPKPGKAIKSCKDYDRKQTKKLVEKAAEE